MGWNKIYDYTPAPGQFINEDKSGFKGVATREQALAYAESRLKQGEYVSLGGWGGSLVAGFDHSIKDGEGYDLIIRGNTHEGSSEPAIVWVMMDSNGNGQPDDVWYELRGSEYDKPSSKVRYALTYHRPVADFMSVRWQGEGELYGEINRTSQHTQPSYFPQWVEGEYYALYGSIVAHNTTIDGAGNYVNNPYAWGYADNMGENTISDDEQSCWFDIANAVCDDGSPAELPHIDFVKVQSAVCHQAGPLGEVSAEVTDIRAR